MTIDYSFPFPLVKNITIAQEIPELQSKTTWHVFVADAGHLLLLLLLLLLLQPTGTRFSDLGGMQG